MAVTGDIFRSLTFDGESSRDYGVYITGQAVYNAPERDVEMVTIPGRNGAFALDKGRFENIEVTYPAGVFANTDTEFAKAISDFRNMLCSRQGYCRLIDEYNPDEYRLAVYKSGLEVDPVQLKAGQFDITFECKPQRYLTSGEEKKVLGTWGDTETETGDIVELENDGSLAVKSAEVSLEPQQDLHGYDKPWSGGNGKNILKVTASSQTINDVVFTIDSNGVIDANGTASARIDLILNNGISWVGGQTYKIGGSVGGSASTWVIWVATHGTVQSEMSMDGEGTFTQGSTATNRVTLTIYGGVQVNHQKFYPMARLASDGDSTFAPYENICPITGASDVDVTVSGKNLVGTGASYSWSPSLTKNTDGSWHVSGSRSSNGALVIGTANLQQGTYVIGRGGGDTNIYFQIMVDSVNVCSTNNGDATFTLTEPKTVTIRIFARGNVTFDTTLYPQIELGNEATSYEPYNGNTTTTSLGTTVYGGYVDVVAGTGTVTWGAKTFNDIQNTIDYNSGSAYFSAIINEKAPGNVNIISSAYNAVDVPSVNNLVSGQIKGHNTTHAIYWKDSNYTSKADFLTAMGNEQICYELATPTTLTPTPTTVNLIEGTNYVFSPQGDLTLEYGTNPNVLVNPTLFGSSPMIEAKGYGDITFNGHTISLQNGVVGTVNLWDKVNTYGLNGTVTKQFQTGLFNPTDTFSFGVGDTFNVDTQYSTVTNTNPSVSNIVSHLSDDSWLYGIHLPCSFTINTSGTVTNTSTYDFGSGKTIVVTMTVTYDASAGSVAYTIATVKTGNVQFILGKSCYTLGRCDATSTLNRLGNPTYIDCDLGEAYKINDGDVVGLNQFIDLGSKLPELASGINEFTVSNTFTEVAVVPRWWKV